MFSQEELEKAQKRLEGMGISTNIMGSDSLYVSINDVELELSEYEIRYQIKSYENEQDES